jgi:hypothetical protein
MVNKKIFDNKKVLCAILVLAGTISAFALNIDGKAPTFTGVNDPTISAAIDAAFGVAFGGVFGQLKEKAQGIDDKPEQFIRSWGNSGVFASHGATQRAYGDYKLFAFTLGPMLGLQLPGNPFNIAGDLGNLAEKLNKDGDIKLGLNPQIISAKIGINASKFLLDKLHLGLHFGSMKLDKLFVDGFSFNTFSLGATANYQLIPQLNLAGLLLWRGVNVGSGLIYQGTKIGYTIGLGTCEQPLVVSGTTVGNFSIAPVLFLDMNINTVTIPLEATTAVRLLRFLNIPLGVGVDLGFGKSDLKIGMNGDISVTNLTASYPGISVKPGNVSVTAGGDMLPSFFNLKFMTGFGFNFGPAILDIPVTIYADKGYNVGITVGVVF